MESTTTPSITEIIEQWLYGRPKLTQKAYLRDSLNGLAFLGDPPLDAITLADLQHYQTYLYIDQRQAPRTVNRKLSALRSLLKFAHEQDWIIRNPAIALRSPKVHENLQERILSVEQVKAIINAAQPGRNRTMIAFAYLTGARIAEICGLLWKDCRPKPNGAAVVRLLGKREKWRSVKIPAELWADMAKLKGESPDDSKVFQLAPRQAHDILKAAVNKANAPDEASFHWLRHSSASHSLEAGAPIHVVRDTLGHASIQTTDKYLHSSPEESSSDYLNL